MIWIALIAIMLGLWLYAWMLYWEYKENEKHKAKRLLEHRRRIMEGRHDDEQV